MELKSENQQIVHSLLAKNEIELFIKREDQLHPHISGNKFRKLKYNLANARNKNYQTLLTFGGAYSNHIVATAAAGKEYGFHTIGVIRGKELAINLKKTLAENLTLNFAFQQGMELHFVSRSDYKIKATSTFISGLTEKFGNFYMLPEGGTNNLAVKGCEEILTSEDKKFDIICCSVGTGGTISGIINASKSHQQIIGFPALKENYLHQEILNFTNKTNWKLNRNHHLGGYAKITPELIEFTNSFYSEQKILLDPIYTGKLIKGIFEEVKQGNFPKKTRILAIHTGGLQGISGINTILKKNHQTLIKTTHEI